MLLESCWKAPGIVLTCGSVLLVRKGRVSKHISEPHLKNEFLKSLEQEELAWNCEQEGKQPTDSSDKSTNHETSLLKSLEDSVQFWTDYSKVHFHPQSLYELEGVWHETTPFDDYGSGKGLLKGLAKEDVLDRLRFFVEEADHLQVDNTLHISFL